MENTRQQIPFDEMKINNEGGFFLHQAASWAMFISIVGFIALGLLAAAYLIGAVMLTGVDTYVMAQNPGMPYSPATMFSWTGFFIILVSCLIGVIPYIYQYNFARRVKKSFEQKNTEMLTHAFRALKNYYVFTGVILIIALLMIILSFVSLFMFLPM